MGGTREVALLHEDTTGRKSFHVPLVLEHGLSPPMINSRFGPLSGLKPQASRVRRQLPEHGAAGLGTPAFP